MVFFLLESVRILGFIVLQLKHFALVVLYTGGVFFFFLPSLSLYTSA